jgi:hypothetical protein
LEGDPHRFEAILGANDVASDTKGTVPFAARCRPVCEQTTRRFSPASGQGRE